jgi:hypothetical protein
MLSLNTHDRVEVYVTAETGQHLFLANRRNTTKYDEL